MDDEAMVLMTELRAQQWSEADGNSLEEKEKEKNLITENDMAQDEVDEEIRESTMEKRNELDGRIQQQRMVDQQKNVTYKKENYILNFDIEKCQKKENSSMVNFNEQMVDYIEIPRRRSTTRSSR